MIEAIQQHKNTQQICDTIFWTEAHRTLALNFLAHLHIAAHCQSDALGNLLGDFVKGQIIGYPAHVAAGIRLHRAIDALTDRHPIMSQLKPYFAPERRRFAPIALDIFWDYCLANHWAHYHPQPLTQFCEQTHTQIHQAIGQWPRETVQLPETFLRIHQRMWQDRWLLAYQDFDTLGWVLKRLASRSPRMGPLADCVHDLTQSHDDCRHAFGAFYDDVLTYARQQTAQA